MLLTASAAAVAVAAAAAAAPYERLPVAVLQLYMKRLIYFSMSALSTSITSAFRRPYRAPLYDARCLQMMKKLSPTWPLMERATVGSEPVVQPNPVALKSNAMNNNIEEYTKLNFQNELHSVQDQIEGPLIPATMYVMKSQLSQTR
jgi:hypothetical protein